MLAKIVFDFDDIGGEKVTERVDEIPALPVRGQVVNNSLFQEMGVSGVVKRIEWEFVPGVAVASTGFSWSPIIFINVIKTEKKEEAKIDPDSFEEIPLRG